jgi:signal transduction histidine kinase
VTPRAPTLLLAAALLASIATIAGFGVYAVREIRELGAEQTAIAERNRLDSLQLFRIQNNLANVATSMRDMADRTEPYPIVAWRQTFERLRADLDEAIAAEAALAPARRPAAQQQRLRAAVGSFWVSLEDVFRQAAAGDEEGALRRVRTSLTAQHSELVSIVSQFLVLNNREQQEAAERNREVYERVEREIGLLVGVLLLLVALIGLYTIYATRRAFQEVARLSGELRHLSWRMLRLQEDLQQSFSRELHDEFGQVFTAIGTLLGRIGRNLPAGSPLVRDVEEVRAIAQQTLERIRVQSRLLHPTVLDDFGLERAVQWYVEQFGRQHGIVAHFETTGPVGVVPPESTIHVYRIVQEALTNVSRHAGATEAWVRLGGRDGRLFLEIEDRGRGLPAGGAHAERGVGLVSMRERAELMGGTFSLRPASPRGTIVSVQVPIGMAQGAEPAPLT